MLSKAEKDYIIELLEKGEAIPEDFKYKLFPVEHKEYELAYADKMRKEDLLADVDGSFPMPLQVEKIFNAQEEPLSGEWKNMVVFGDNLQMLKTINKNEDPLIKDKVKGKVRLIYIDPPFATSDDFQSKDGAKAYADKKKGAEFIEYLRKRLIVAKEILSDDGTIYVHLDSKMGHYIKVLMDEIFSSFDFSEIIWVCGLMGSGDFFPKAHETIYCYKSKSAVFNPQNRLGLSKRITGALAKDDNGWYYTRGRESSGGMNCLKTYVCSDTACSKEQAIEYANATRKQPAWSVWIGKKEIATEYNDFPVGTYAYTSQDSTGYPTQKPEQLLKRIIQSSTNEGDLVLDFFGGSGTTAAVAEKLGRRWITCDMGKLSFYTVQKRILQIQNSRDLNKTTKKYGKRAKPFLTLSLGNYDLKAALDLEFNKYKTFVSGLFHVDLMETQIGGYLFDGKKEDHPVIIFNYNLHKDSNIDELFIEGVHERVGNRMKGGRVYIVAPSTRIDFITDYEEIEGTRYYFLKIPYQIIKELHQKEFKKFRQPRSKNQVNALDESIGFSFNRTPKVHSAFAIENKKVKIYIHEFSSEEPRSSKTTEEKFLSGFDLLSAVFVDKNYNGKEFMMTNSFFPDEMNWVDDQLVIELDEKSIGNKIMVVYTDIFGNDLTECFSIGKEEQAYAGDENI